MVAIRPLEEIAKKYEEVTPGRASYYFQSLSRVLQALWKRLLRSSSE